MQYNNIPNDPAMLLSFVNLKLRDEFSSFDEMCNSLACDKDTIVKKLKMIDYEYDKKTNQFV
ncbi:MAG: DUF4250 domain-containing protein [Lachnospiraceae bacterium]|nr:DUF4250 domain-containing protein [Lachnospiraceae bacterium]MEE0959771.1 DUF4250 domain-containing protein [Lachnospiraceae bacterium]